MDKDSKDLDGLSVEQINEMFGEILNMDEGNNSLIAWCDTSRCKNCNTTAGCASNWF